MQAKSFIHLSPDEMPKMPFFIEEIPARFIRENKIIPIELKDGVLKVVMANPNDRAAIDAVSVVTSFDVQVHTCDERVISDFISRFYTQEGQDVGSIIEDIGDDGLQFLGEDDENVGQLKDMASEAPVIKLVNLFLSRAVENRASDIHIEPFKEELKVRYRIDGVLHDVETIPKKLQAAIVSRIKLMAKLNIAERRLPQDGRIRAKVLEKDIDLRVSTIPVLHGESLVMRILDKENIVIDLEQMGFHADTLSTLNHLIMRPNGIILVTGPTGSGKTTTLYGALEKINSPDKKIITVEDPVEYQLQGVNQIQVKPQIGLTFPSVLRHIVRQDPDIIMIGEIRDLETAEIAIQSALTGHLVFSTLHTNDAPSALTRLIDLGVGAFLLSSTIRGILAQRLVRMICPSCKQVDPTEISQENLQSLGLSRDTVFYKGKGCDRCANTGYYGRSGIFELLVVNDEIQQLIIKQADVMKIQQAACRNGMKTLIEDGGRKVAAGVTTISEIFRVTQEV